MTWVTYFAIVYKNLGQAIRSVWRRRGFVVSPIFVGAVVYETYEPENAFGCFSVLLFCMNFLFCLSRNRTHLGSMKKSKENVQLTLDLTFHQFFEVRKQECRTLSRSSLALRALPWQEQWHTGGSTPAISWGTTSIL
eukprot:g32225.t1